MEPVFIVSREEFHDVQMELKRVQSIQHQHSDRLRTLERRQADDAALKSVWHSPFPSVLGGTPQQGPVQMSSADILSDLDDEQGQSLLGTLQLDPEDEPIRRGAASRANSVRFDESALHGAFGGHRNHHSTDFGIIRPSSGMGGHQMMERSSSHKSDGRHSSAGHSVHSVHSGVSGRASSLGLDTNFVIGGREDDDSPINVPEPPPVVYILGSAPSIVRCWLTTNFTSDKLLYAVVCTGSQKSTVEYSLLRELGLVNNIHRDVDGVQRIQLPVFLAEARVTQSNSRARDHFSSQPQIPQLPSITANFEVTGLDQPDSVPETKTAIRVFIGNHTLRLHSADLLLSQNCMTLYGTDRDKLSIPFVRPEDDAVFRHLTVANIVPGKAKLNAAAPEFVAGERPAKVACKLKEEPIHAEHKPVENGSEEVLSPTTQLGQDTQPAAPSTASESGAESEKHQAEPATSEPSGKENSGTAEPRREPSAAIRTPWRQTAVGLGDGSTPLSGYQPAVRPRSMKVLRPTKSSSSSSSAKTGTAYEPAPTPRSSGEQLRRKGQADAGQATTTSWGGSKRSISGPAFSFGPTESKPPPMPTTPTAGTMTNNHHDGGKSTPLVPRTANNPLGSASAFSFLKPKTPTAAAE
ncbi:hypothetical protein QBC35DRAFT_378647 [Podospora australis]|uniref:Ubiquitin carboxyl-terminal hydrolase 19 n=1 Tax=Podospora australis TaxID=1536484 RepID=A0AAN7AIQ1_9PEZI|nr:hypothetical protein QBC35DRAFT_378647 [Podospora australis]